MFVYPLYHSLPSLSSPHIRTTCDPEGLIFIPLEIAFLKMILLPRSNWLLKLKGNKCIGIQVTLYPEIWFCLVRIELYLFCYYALKMFWYVYKILKSLQFFANYFLFLVGFIWFQHWGSKLTQLWKIVKW